ncbi:hypothetical protein BKA80DRAFT_598 [Phyllosticta citrichinensis]
MGIMVNEPPPLELEDIARSWMDGRHAGRQASPTTDRPINQSINQYANGAIDYAPPFAVPASDHAIDWRLSCQADKTRGETAVSVRTETVERSMSACAICSFRALASRQRRGGKGKGQSKTKTGGKVKMNAALIPSAGGEMDRAVATVMKRLVKENKGRRKW